MEKRHIDQTIHNTSRREKVETLLEERLQIGGNKWWKDYGWRSVTGWTELETWHGRQMGYDRVGELDTEEDGVEHVGKYDGSGSVS
jgi:hypothetical protein